MAECVISAIIDTSNGNTLVPACMVHITYAPCPHDGEPACPSPVHSFRGRATRDQAVHQWQLRTRRQRPLVIHDELRIPDPAAHVCETEILPCPCGAEVLQAVAS